MFILEKCLLQKNGSGLGQRGGSVVGWQLHGGVLSIPKSPGRRPSVALPVRLAAHSRPLIWPLRVTVWQTDGNCPSRDLPNHALAMAGLMGETVSVSSKGYC